MRYKILVIFNYSNYFNVILKVCYLKCDQFSCATNCNSNSFTIKEIKYYYLKFVIMLRNCISRASTSLKKL